MNRYDRGWNAGNRARRSARYGSDYYGGWETAWGSAPSAGFRTHGAGMYRQWGTPEEPRRYDRDVYGSAYPEFGGYPGGSRRGTYYGGGPRSRAPGYGTDYARGIARGYDEMYGRNRYAGGYDRGYTELPFMPEEAYRRHPEYDRPQAHRTDRWPAGGHDLGAGGMDLDDEEIGYEVRESLQRDEYLDANRIEVEVHDGVVTLRGEVDRYLEARYAWDDAWDAAGVRGVVNQLTVRVDVPADEDSNLPQTE